MTTVATPTPLLQRVRHDWQKYVVYIGFVLVFVFFAITQGANFLNLTTLVNIATQAAPITIMAVGTVFVLSLGEIDLSIGSTVALSALSAAVALQVTGWWWAGALAGLLVGALVGFVNGVFITAFRLPSFLVTLATMGLVAGLAQQITNLQSVPVTDATFVWIFGGGTLAGVPILIWWSLVIAVLGWHVLRQRRAGAHVLAVGNNAQAARVSGVKVARVRLMVFTFSGIAAALAGILYAGRLAGATYTLGTADLMSVLAAVIVGGTALAGGRGSIIGAVVGSLFMSMINYGLLLGGLTVAQQMIVRGVIILLAVTLSLRGKKGQ
ncbi:ribose transport system permease protein [Microbacterium keratanolyticum]|uniref:Autoinducer 2 import system permease protein LsrD n=1 Tax=Microbacterium keratanolyticum TaxID=67574 RepID=A0A9W6HQJ6_9MICO|nr:ABC transporter permease [Microbacterium keratanolyticum]MBM7468571.1 ribose transport system permease protein [Microbacterium keratanolyticum]GLK00648.1 ABC transporter permease [Microbacterium keratanolyticum]